MCGALWSAAPPLAIPVHRAIGWRSIPIEDRGGRVGALLGRPCRFRQFARNHHALDLTGESVPANLGRARVALPLLERDPAALEASMAG
jgi:hypothetical protein